MQYVLMQRHLQVNIKPEHADVKNERWCVTLLLPKVTAFCLHWKIVRRIKEKWWLNRDNRMALEQREVFYMAIAGNGTIVDRVLVKTRAARSPLCRKRAWGSFQSPLRFNVPLNLLKSLNIA